MWDTLPQPFFACIIVTQDHDHAQGPGPLPVPLPQKTAFSNDAEEGNSEEP